MLDVKLSSIQRLEKRSDLPEGIGSRTKAGVVVATFRGSPAIHNHP
jgi:hypothetical protein